MFTSIVNQIAQQHKEPALSTISNEAQQIYKQGLDKVNEYRGDPRIFSEAIALFEQTGSLPLFYAGIAYVHVVAAYKENIHYDQAELVHAGEWLKKAEEVAGVFFENQIVKLYICIYSRRFDEAKQLLEELEGRHQTDFYLQMAKIDFYAVKENKNQMSHVYQKTLPLALTVTRRAYLQNRVARYLVMFRHFNEAIVVYQELAKLTPGDPWMWHNMSIIHLSKGNLWLARRCNKLALQLMEFSNARFIERKIRERTIEWLVKGGAIVIVIVLVILRIILR